MRLLNANTLVFNDEFPDLQISGPQQNLWNTNPNNKIPPYAILTHRWLKTEVTHKYLKGDSSDKFRGQLVEKLNNGPLSENNGIFEDNLWPSVRKLLGLCQQARLAKLEWVWIDTCCID
jgi:hypothetical protein